MEGKEIAILVIFLIFGLPILIKIAWWGLTYNHNTIEDNTKTAGNLIAEAAVPWWLGIFEWLAKIGGTIGALLIIAFVGFLIWVGEIKPRRY